MAAVTHICTHCGYEGKPVKPPKDEEAGDGETGRALDKVANIVFPGMGMLIRPLAMALVMPIYIILWPIKRKLNGPKHCPNCGLPTMVSLKSDAGWLAKRKHDLKSGLVVLIEGKAYESDSLFAQTYFAEQRAKEPKARPLPDALPALHEILNDTPPPITPPEPQPEPKKKITPVAPPPKKPDPDVW